jgi:4-hydroxy-2-oxoheptanedioate aldolase
MVESPEQAAALVAAMRYPPGGIRGVGGSLARATRWNRVSGYARAADDVVCLVCQIESATGVERAAEIAAVDGVDALFVGPSDLAASMGHIGDTGHPDVQAAVAATIAAVTAAGKPVGLFATSVESAHEWVARGATFVAVGADISLLPRAAGDLASALRAR